MINVLSTTDQYILQPSLLSMHRQTLDWMSATQLWKRELDFFQKLLEQASMKAPGIDLKKKVDHFQHLITYYGGEVVDGLHKKLRGHETHLANMLQNLNESDVEYFREHKGIMEETSTFATAFAEFKREFFGFVEKVL
jgi:hypothetical protein